jgi:integrase
MEQFTDKKIKSLKPKDHIYDVREKNGFAIRVFPSGEKSWVFIYTFSGRKRRMTLGDYKITSLADARIKHHDAYKLLKAEGKDPAQLKMQQGKDDRDSFSVENLVKEYITKWAKPRKRSWAEDDRILNKDILPSWRLRKAKDITRRDVILLLDKIKERGAPIAANRTLACVRRMFNFAIEQDIINSSPCVAVKAPAKENQRDRCLSTDEIKIIWNNLDGIILDEQDNAKAANDDKVDIKMSLTTKIALKLQLVTAQRKGEIVSMEWSEINLDTNWWTIPAAKAKNGQSHRVYLSPLALELLQQAKIVAAKSRWIFPSPHAKAHISPTALSRALNRSTFEKPVAYFTPHDLRRTAATHMTAMGISRLVVSKILNHVESSVTAIYDRHSYDNEKTHALESWWRKLLEITTNTIQTSNVIHLAH